MKTSDKIGAALRHIPTVNPEWLARAQQHQNSLTKPPGSLGRLEEIANRLCAIQETLAPAVRNPVVLVFAADHGICEEHVNPYPQSVTRQMVENFLAGGAAINALARTAGAELIVIDVGVLGDSPPHPGLLVRSVGPGTRNFCREAAMSPEQAEQAISTGMDVARSAIERGSTLLVLGEMGIGNTTVASALCCALTGCDPSSACGRGTGSDAAGVLRKVDAVSRGLTLHREHLGNPFAALSRLGGFEIAAMCGLCLEAARNRCAVVVDGFISAAAAALAVAMHPLVNDYLIAGHESAEPGHCTLLNYLKLEPLLRLQMRLGEGTGGALAIPIIRAAAEAFRSMATFESAGVAGAVSSGSRMQ